MWNRCQKLSKVSGRVNRLAIARLGSAVHVRIRKFGSGCGAAPGGYDRVGYGPQLVGCAVGVRHRRRGSPCWPMGPAGAVGPIGHTVTVVRWVTLAIPRAPPGFPWPALVMALTAMRVRRPSYWALRSIINTPPTQVREFVIGFGPIRQFGKFDGDFPGAAASLIYRGSRLIVRRRSPTTSPSTTSARTHRPVEGPPPRRLGACGQHQDLHLGPRDPRHHHHNKHVSEHDCRSADVLGGAHRDLDAVSVRLVPAVG